MKYQPASILLSAIALLLLLNCRVAPAQVTLNIERSSIATSAGLGCSGLCVFFANRVCINGVCDLQAPSPVANLVEAYQPVVADTVVSGNVMRDGGGAVGSGGAHGDSILNANEHVISGHGYSAASATLTCVPVKASGSESCAGGTANGDMSNDVAFTVSALTPYLITATASVYNLSTGSSVTLFGPEGNLFELSGPVTGRADPATQTGILQPGDYDIRGELLSSTSTNSGNPPYPSYVTGRGNTNGQFNYRLVLGPTNSVIRTPSNNSAFPVGASIAASYSCTDTLTGAPTPICDGSAAVSDPVDTSTPGAKTFSVTAGTAAADTTTTQVSYVVSDLSYSTPESIWTFAGSGFAEPLGDSGPAQTAGLSSPESVTTDANGNVFISDSGNLRIRKVTLDGKISSVTGQTSAQLRGLSAQAQGLAAGGDTLLSVGGIATDSDGNLYVADPIGNSVRKVDAQSGTITTIAGRADCGGTFGGDGGSASDACLSGPSTVALDHAGNLFIADTEAQRVRRVDAASGIISTVAGSGAADFTGDAGPALAASLRSPQGLALDQKGNLYICDFGNSRVRRVDAQTGAITTVAGNDVAGFAGDGGPATAASMSGPVGIALDAAGNLFISDEDIHRVRRIDSATGTITTVVGTGSVGFSGDGGMGTAATLMRPKGLTIDAKGTLYIADSGNHRIRMVPAVGPAADTTPPTITPAVVGPLGNNEWYIGNVSVSWKVADADSPITTQSGCDPVTISADTSGQTLTCTATSTGGTSTQSVTIKRDATPPTIAITSPTAAGTYAQGALVKANYACSDVTSGSLTCIGTVNNGSPIDTATAGGKSFTVSAVDSAGNTASANISYSVTVADTTAPIIEPIINGTVGGDGWYRSDVSVTWRITDAESAVTSTNGCGPRTISGDTSGVTLTCSATSAGGTGKISVTIKRDTAAPLVGILFPVEGLVLGRNSKWPAVYACLDFRSGTTRCMGTVPFGSYIDTNTAGPKTFIVTAQDRAGNTSTSTVHYRVR